MPAPGPLRGSVTVCNGGHVSAHEQHSVATSSGSCFWLHLTRRRRLPLQIVVTDDATVANQACVAFGQYALLVDSLAVPSSPDTLVPLLNKATALAKKLGLWNGEGAGAARHRARGRCKRACLRRRHHCSMACRARCRARPMPTCAHLPRCIRPCPGKRATHAAAHRVSLMVAAGIVLYGRETLSADRQPVLRAVDLADLPNTQLLGRASRNRAFSVVA